MPPILAVDGVTDTSVLIELAKASPGLLVAVILTVLFLRRMDKSDKVIESISENATSAIKENTEALGRVSEILDNHRQLVKDAVRDGIDAARFKAA